MTNEERAKMRAFVRRLDEARRTKAEELEPTISLARGLTPEEKDRTLRAVVGAGWHILRSRSDFDRVVHSQEPPAPDFPQIWRRLHERYVRMKHEAPTNGRD